MKKLLNMILFPTIAYIMAGCYSFDTTNFSKTVNSNSAPYCAVEITGIGLNMIIPNDCVSEFSYARNATLTSFISYNLEIAGLRRGDTDFPLSLSFDMSPEMHTDWSHGVIDTLINVPGALCLFSFWSVRQKCDATLKIFSYNKQLLKTYTASKSYNSKVVGFIFAAGGDFNQQPQIIEWRLKHALAIDLLNQFLIDYQKKAFDSIIVKWKTQQMSRRKKLQIE